MALTKVSRSLISGGVVSVLDYGALDNNSSGSASANTTAIKAACAAVQSAGGGVLLFPYSDAGIYQIDVTVGDTIGSFVDLPGVEIRFEGTTLKDIQTYPGSTDTSTLFSFTRCKNIEVNANIESALIVTGASPTARGLIATKLVDTCTNFDIKLTMNGGRNGVWITRDPLTENKSRQGRIDVDCTSVLYPYAATWSGDDVIANINATLCGRNFFIYGVSNNTIRVNSKNQQITSLIDGNGGSAVYTEGCSNIDVDFYDRNTDNGSGAPLIELVFRVAATAYKNIKVDLDVSCPASNGFGDSFRFVNTDATTGHSVNGLTISGVSEKAAGVAHGHVDTNFAFASGDSISNVLIENLKCTGAAANFNLPLEQLAGPTATFNNVLSDDCALIATNGGNGIVNYIGCRTTYTSTGTDAHAFLNCVLTDSGTQNDSGKRYINTVLGAAYTTLLNNQYVLTNGIGIIDGVTAPSTDASFAQIYVDTADGDLKIKFSDGTVKTIVTDT